MEWSEETWRLPGGKKFTRRKATTTVQKTLSEERHYLPPIIQKVVYPSITPTLSNEQKRYLTMGIYEKIP